MTESSESPAGEGPLAGFRVLELAQLAAGPYAASLLGDLGADVVKVEPPTGDPFRRIDRFFGSGDSAYFLGINRSKRSVALDLLEPKGRMVLERLVRWADVAIVSFRPSALERLRLRDDDLCPLNPRLVYVEITAFGEDGPHAEDPGMDILAQARSGMMGLTGEPGRGPVKVGAPIADFTVSYLACFAISAALLAREREGVGQKVSLNLLDGQVASLSNFITQYVHTGDPIPPAGSGHPQLVPYQVFDASDGGFVVACVTDKFWPPLVQAVGRPDLADDPRYDTNDKRVAARAEVVALFQAIFRSRPKAEWLEILHASGVPCGPVNLLADAVCDAQVVHNGSVIELLHPELGPYRVANNPLRFVRTPARVRGPAPGLGADTAAVLAELGFGDDEVAAAPPPARSRPAG